MSRELRFTHTGVASVSTENNMKTINNLTEEEQLCAEFVCLTCGCKEIDGKQCTTHFPVPNLPYWHGMNCQMPFYFMGIFLDLGDLKPVPSDLV